MRLMICLLALISAPVWAGSVSVNGADCGSLKVLSLDSEGNITVATDGTCGLVPADPPPVDPPVIGACPSGVTCIDRTFPIIRQEVVSIRAGQILAFRVNTGASGVGTVYTNNTANLSPNRRVALSTVAGDLNPPNSRCGTSGFESTTSGYVVGTPVDRKCTLPAYSVVYINVQATNCPDGKRCEFLLRAN
jgi:hypothetical protein